MLYHYWHTTMNHSLNITNKFPHVLVGKNVDGHGVFVLLHICITTIGQVIGFISSGGIYFLSQFVNDKLFVAVWQIITMLIRGKCFVMS